MGDKSTGEQFRRTYRIPVAVICACVLITQAVIINTYLVKYYNYWWLFWILADTVSIGLVVLAMIVSCLHHKNANHDNRSAKSPVGELPLGYISWFVYTVFLATRLAIIFKNIAPELQESMLFGPNMLKSGLSLTSIVFFGLLLVQADTLPNSYRDTYINAIVWRITMDILDTVALLDVIFIYESHVILPFSVHKGIIAIACVNIILPTIPLIILSKTFHGKTRLTKGLETLQIVVYLLCVNIPQMVIRLILWHVHDEDISVFLIKNVLSLAMATKHIYDHFVDLAQDKTDGAVRAHDMEESLEMSSMREEDRGAAQRSPIEQGRSVFV